MTLQRSFSEVLAHCLQAAVSRSPIASNSPLWALARALSRRFWRRVRDGGLGEGPNGASTAIGGGALKDGA